MISANAYQLRVLEPPCTLVTYCLLNENGNNNQITKAKNNMLSEGGDGPKGHP